MKRIVKIISLLIITQIIFPFNLLASNSLNLPKIDVEGQEYYVYEVKKGESLYGIAKKMNWDIQEILKINPAANRTLNKGSKLYYPVKLEDNSNSIEKDNSLSTDTNIASLTSNSEFFQHTVKKGETLYSISRYYNVPLEILYKLNPFSKKGIKAGNILIIPLDNSNLQIENNTTVIDDQEIPTEDNIDNNPGIVGEEIVEIIDENEEDFFEEIKIALILDEPNTNKDIDFTRGVLISLSQLEKTPYKIDLKILDGGKSSSDITNELDYYEPDLIITTADKNFPLFLADYGNTNTIPVINVFDLKTDLFEDNTTLIQMLPPSSFFFEKIASEIFNLNRHRKLLAVGETDENDGLGIELLKLFGENGETLTLEEFGALEPDIMEPVVIYSYASKKEDVFDFLNNVDHIYENTPGYDFRIIGRSSWITMIDDLGDKFEFFSVVIPARAWVDESSVEWKEFSEKYENLFNGSPVKSIPNFAASGYDVGNYFIELIEEKRGNLSDMNSERFTSGLQTDVFLRKIHDRGGYLNNIGYIIKFNKDGSIEKNIVK